MIGESWFLVNAASQKHSHYLTHRSPLIIIIRQFIRRRNMSELLQRQTPTRGLLAVAIVAQRIDYV